MPTTSLYQLPNGFYELHLPDGEIVTSRDGLGMTLSEAESAAEFIEQRKERNYDSDTISLSQR